LQLVWVPSGAVGGRAVLLRGARDAGSRSARGLYQQTIACLSDTNEDSNDVAWQRISLCHLG